MKNQHITTLLKEVPIKIRLEVYKEALTIIQSGKPHKAMKSNMLCLLLPCILWDLESTDFITNNEAPFCFMDTRKAFPELTSKIIKDLEWTPGVPETNIKRKKYLKEFIVKLESLNQPFYIKWYLSIKNYFNLK